VNRKEGRLKVLSSECLLGLGGTNNSNKSKDLAGIFTNHSRRYPNIGKASKASWGNARGDAGEGICEKEISGKRCSGYPVFEKCYPKDHGEKVFTKGLTHLRSGSGEKVWNRSRLLTWPRPSEGREGEVRGTPL